jgi:lipopolysaccharide export system permease protein
MTLLERYIFKMAAGAFALCLGGLTAVIWITSAVKEMDLVSGKGQTILVFLKVTLLTLPSLVMVIAPVALFGAILYTLNKLNNDSELIVMNAAGMAPARVLKPLGLLTIFVVVLVGYITIFAMPNSFRGLRDLLTQIRADVVTKFLKEGRFSTLDKGITFHFREKAPNGAMVGILIHDARDASKQVTYLAERGQIVEAEGSAYIVLEQGSVHRQNSGERDSAVVDYERYAIDLDQFGADGEKVTYKPRERSTFELINRSQDDAYTKLFEGRFRAELHDRFASPLYAVAAMAIGFAALGTAKTTRQGRGSAVAGAVIAMIALRVAGFAASSLTARSAVFTPLMYAVPLGAAFAAAALAWRQATSVQQMGRLGQLAATVSGLFADMSQRFVKRAG